MPCWTTVAAAKPDASTQSLAYDRAPEAAATVNLGRDGNAYVNPYTGRRARVAVGDDREHVPVDGARHRRMGASGESRHGRAWTGASNLAFLFLGLTGLYPWWPKCATAKYLRPAVWFKSASTGKARDFHPAQHHRLLVRDPDHHRDGERLGDLVHAATTLVHRLTGKPGARRSRRRPRGRGPGPAGAPRAPGGRVPKAVAVNSAAVVNSVPKGT